MDCFDTNALNDTVFVVFEIEEMC